MKTIIKYFKTKKILRIIYNEEKNSNLIIKNYFNLD